ncbi:MAG: glycine zipper domain-containing protein [Caulobacter sp.]|nr:glycine zipper domain-containing protein [Caulobacter sp.]
MRFITTAAIAVIAMAALPGAANAGVFGCDAAGGKQEGGAVIGAIIGGVIGNQVAKGERGAGTVVGAGIGAAIGSSIGCKMQEEDQRRAEVALNEALATGRPARWRNPNSGAYGEIRVLPAANSGSWYAPNTVNVRATPSTRGRVVGRMAGGETFDGTSYNSGWLRVDGGYVSKSVVRRAPGRDGCETLEQTAYTKKYGRETERYRACRKPGGAWDVRRI